MNYRCRVRLSYVIHPLLGIATPGGGRAIVGRLDLLLLCPLYLFPFTGDGG